MFTSSFLLSYEALLRHVNSPPLSFLYINLAAEMSFAKATGVKYCITQQHGEDSSEPVCIATPKMCSGKKNKPQTFLRYSKLL